MSASLIERFEAAIRRFFSRFGGALDRTIGGSSPFDLASVIPIVEQAIETGLRKQNGRIEAPNRIDLRYDYETYARLTHDQIDYLRSEIRSNAIEFVYNRRYTIRGDLKVNASFDPFAKKLKVETAFDDVPEKPKPLQGARVPAYVIGLRLTGGVLPSLHRVSLAAGSESATIGRSRDNAIVVDHSSVSNFHASFTRTADSSLWLADLASSNGTFVNGIQVLSNERKFVRAGDRLRFGDVDATLEISEETAGTN
jgi:hypothetical protein